MRNLEKESKASSYIVRFKNVILSWLNFNDISLQLTVNIKGEKENPTIANERVPSKEVQGDKGYYSRSNFNYLNTRVVKATILQRDNSRTLSRVL